jgi:hypothetical protein
MAVPKGAGLRRSSKSEGGRAWGGPERELPGLAKIFVRHPVRLMLGGGGSFTG